MTPYQTKVKKSAGSNYFEVRRQALRTFRDIEQQTKRRSYIRSAYFNKEKVFFDYFWDHLWQKSPKERFKRLPYFRPAIELIQSSCNKPVSKRNPNKTDEIVHRFAGITRDKELFYVQIKESRNGKKYFMSCFPPE